MDLDFPKHFSGQVMWYYVTMRPCSITFSCASIYTLNQGFLVLSHATMVVPLPPQSVLWSCTYDAWQWIIWCFCLWLSRQAVEVSSTSQHAVQSASQHRVHRSSQNWQIVDCHSLNCYFLPYLVTSLFSICCLHCIHCSNEPRFPHSKICFRPEHDTCSQRHWQMFTGVAHHHGYLFQC